MKIIHSIGRPVKVGIDARTRCGKSASVDTVGAFAANMIDAAGNQFFGSPFPNTVTCKKCINLLTVGTIHAKRPSRPASPEKRAVARNPVGRPKGGRLR